MFQCAKTTKDGRVRCQGREGHEGGCFFGGVTLADFDRVMAALAHLRCEVTTNPVGTDTWSVGHSCPCATCQTWFKTGSPLSPLRSGDERKETK
jgi:hypothetical protein